MLCPDLRRHVVVMTALIIPLAVAVQAQPCDLDVTLQQVRESLQASDHTLAESTIERLERYVTECPVQAQRAIDDIGEIGRDFLAQGRPIQAGRLMTLAVDLIVNVEDEHEADHVFLHLDLAAAHYYGGAYSDAQRVAQRALDMMEPDFDPGLLAEATNLLGLAAFSQGNFTTARLRYEQALGLLATSMTTHPGDAAVIRVNLASLLHQLGDFAAARLHYEHAVNVSTQLGDSLGLAIDLDRLAFLLIDQGDVSEARRLLRESIEIMRVVLSPTDVRLAPTMHNLGLALFRSEESEEARQIVGQALAMVEDQLGSLHPEAARNHRLLGLIAISDDDWHAASHHLKRARDIYVATLGPTHTNVASTMVDLARVATGEGLYPDADSLLVAAIDQWTDAFGVDNLFSVHALNMRAMLAMRLGADEAESYSRTREASRIVTSYIERVLPVLSVAEQQAFIDTYVSRQTSLLLSSGHDNLDSAYWTMAGWKGLLQSGLVAQARLQAGDGDPEAVAHLNDVRSALGLLHRAQYTTEPAIWRSRVDSLTVAKEQLERRLLANSPRTDQRKPVNRSSLADVLPGDAAFVDVYQYQRFADGSGQEHRYMAVVVAPDGSLRTVDLGPADSLHASVGAWRRELTRSETLSEATRSMVASLWGPLDETLPAGTRRVWLSPDDQLARIPWATLASLHHPEDSLLVAEIASARALATLLSESSRHTERAGLLLVGDVDFGDSPEWEPLPGTRREIEAIALIGRGRHTMSAVLDGIRATPEAVATALAGSGFAHLATHGFFLSDNEAAGAGSRGFGNTPLAQQVGPEGALTLNSRNPLVHSGLVLSGGDGEDPAYLTADDLLSIDMRELELLVLSACDTGRGMEVTGQGVMGLRASVEAAGARTLLMSLWKVPDHSTALLMEHFYRSLWEDDAVPAEALKRAQAAVRAEYPAPVHWAAWVLSGAAW